MTVFLLSCKFKLCLTLETFKAALARAISSTQLWAGWLLYLLGQGPVHAFLHTHLRDHLTLGSETTPPYDLACLVLHHLQTAEALST